MEVILYVVIKEMFVLNVIEATHTFVWFLTILNRITMSTLLKFC